ncbi:protein-S-isoprenylcysteine O-methyltransferase-like [Tubulanus polymorphus]|uniref:protein-S-isoprenylcysteine O-methyltransferase-like n=1 Tax=Tubulanus polymorphus TaxID=672921 RepID=UPI003DA420A8
MIIEAKDSLTSFLTGSCIILIAILANIGGPFAFVFNNFFYIAIALYVVVFGIWLSVNFKGPRFQNAIRGGFLGLVFGIGLMLSVSGWVVMPLGWYIAMLAFFHWSEYFVTALTNPSHIVLDSYLLNHSTAYQVAAVASWIEYTIELLVFPEMKKVLWLSAIGLLIVMFGEALRKIAMCTARSNFNHYVQHVKEEGHILVTHGVYRFFRHPAYVGWFWWSVGTQIILVNPICFIAYTAASWKFFQGRVVAEEITLLNFFGEQYLDYQKRVGTGLPFIKGYRGEL